MTLTTKTKQVSRFYDVREELPLFSDLVIGYSNQEQQYFLCRFSPFSGWSSNDFYCGRSCRVEHISHWIELPFELPFESTPQEGE